MAAADRFYTHEIGQEECVARDDTDDGITEVLVMIFLHRMCTVSCGGWVCGGVSSDGSSVSS